MWALAREHCSTAKIRQVSQVGRNVYGTPSALAVTRSVSEGPNLFPHLRFGLRGIVPHSTAYSTRQPAKLAIQSPWPRLGHVAGNRKLALNH